MNLKFVVAALSLSLIFLSCSERMDSAYADLAEARADGAVERGWVPVFLPDSAKHIRERHDLDTNATWAAFRFDPSDSDRFMAHLSPLAEESFPVRDPGPVDWWPEYLRGELNLQRLAGRGFSVWRGTGDRVTYFAVNVRAGEGFFWR